MHETVHRMWRDYLNTADSQDFDRVSTSKIPAWHFCDNKEDADECARLVMIGKKRATTPSLWELQLNKQEIPMTGDLNVITNWEGIAQCIIQTTFVEIVPFKEVTSEYARLEGEGDGSLSYWRKVHQAYYERVLKESDHSFQKNMPVVCEQFEKVFPLL